MQGGGGDELMIPPRPLNPHVWTVFRSSAKYATPRRYGRLPIVIFSGKPSQPLHRLPLMIMLTTFLRSSLLVGALEGRFSNDFD